MNRSISQGVVSVFLIFIFSVTCFGDSYNAIILQPSDAAGSSAYAVNGNVQVGTIFKSASHPSMKVVGSVWQSTPNNPTYLIGSLGSMANDIDGKQVVGTTITFQAALWTEGTAESYINLHPAGFANSWATGADHGTQVGYGCEVVNGPTRALMWNGSAQSVVNLHPNNYYASSAEEVYNGVQVGCGIQQDSGQPVALMWNGSSQNVTLLHPSGYYNSDAKAVWGDYQAGYASNSPSVTHAAIWHGSSTSMIDVHPTGFIASQIDDACGVYQVGTGWTYDGSYHALLWHWSGSSYSVIDLQSYLPSEYVRSHAYGVDAFGNIVGEAYLANSSYGHAILWKNTIPEPCTLAFLALGGLWIRRRKLCAKSA